MASESVLTTRAKCTKHLTAFAPPATLVNALLRKHSGQLGIIKGHKEQIIASSRDWMSFSWVPIVACPAAVFLLPQHRRSFQPSCVWWIQLSGKVANQQLSAFNCDHCEGGCERAATDERWQLRRVEGNFMRQEVSGAEMVSDTKMVPSFCLGEFLTFLCSSLFNYNSDLKRR